MPPIPPRTYSRLAILALAGASSVLLAGCGIMSTSSAPATTTSSTPAKTPETLAPPSGPVWPYAEATEPPQMQRVDSAGACAFAEYALRVSPEDIAKGRTQRIEEYAGEQCELCNSDLAAARGVRKGLAWVRGQNILSAEVLRADELEEIDNGWVCDFDIHQAGGTAWVHTSENASTIPESHYEVSVYVAHGDKGWKVLEIRPLAG